MIYEYAVDPKTVSNWSIFKHIVEWFGVEHGRLISEYPKKWRKHVLEACRQCKEIERARILEALIGMKRTIPAERYWSDDLDWIDNAINQHKQKPFRAILSFGNADKHEDVLDEDQLDSNNHLWHAQTSFRIPKSAESISECARFLIRISKKTKLIDPYFSTKRCYAEVLLSLLKIVNAMDDVYEIQIHTKDGSFFTDSNAIKAIKEKANPLVGIYVFQWDSKESGDAFHARYILSQLGCRDLEVGGMCFDSGLNVGKQGKTTDVSLLSRELSKERWNQFEEYSHEFNLVKSRKL